MSDLFDRILAADARIRPQVPVSPLELSAVLSAEFGCELWFKCDHLQPTGSFKIRGATNRIQLLVEQGHKGGVITASTGNHGQAVARAGALASVPVTVYVCPSILPVKREAIASWGAEIVTVPGESLDAELKARSDPEASGTPYIAPYNHFDTMAGQGTLGVELARSGVELDAVFLCVGGGGLAGGVGTALKRLSPRTKLVGVWPEHSRCMLDSLEAGEIIATPEYDTLSDGSVGAVEPGSVTFPVCREVIDRTLSVSEAEIARAIGDVARTDHWIVEGAAGVALAGLRQAAADHRGKRVAVVLCGRNVALDTFLGAIRRAA